MTEVREGLRDVALWMARRLVLFAFAVCPWKPPVEFLSSRQLQDLADRLRE